MNEFKAEKKEKPEKQVELFKNIYQKIIAQG
jgi:hypothetical protein